MSKKILILLLFGLQLCITKVSAQIPVGTYVGIDYATNYTNPSSGPACVMTQINAAIGDADFINGAAEIPLGWSFAGTWNSGAIYMDGPGIEVLLVSLHTYTETWDVALLLSDGSTTAFTTYALTIVTNNATGTLASCGTIFPGPYNYERPSQELDFASYIIPPGIGVIGIVFEPLTDGAANPDPHGVLILENTPVLDPGASITTDSTCFNTCYGTATVVDGPDVPYTYEWDAAAGNATTQSVSNLCAGSYTVYATGFSGEIDTLIANIIEYPELTISEVSATANVCFGEDGQIEVTGVGGTTPYQYSVNGSPFGASGIFDPLVPGNYTFIVQDANLCEDSLTSTIVEGAPIDVDEAVTDEICPDDCQGTITLSATGDLPMSYSINNCTTTLPNGNFTDLCDATYNICIQDVNGCEYSSVLTVNPAVEIEYPSTMLNDTVICNGVIYTLTAPDENNFSTSYSWNDGTQGRTIQITSPGIYIVTMSNICNTSIDSVTIDYKLCDLEVPNVISIAEGSQNPLWYVIAEGLSSFNLVITNRWGNVVYECNDVNAQCYWDGRDQSGSFVVEGTYFYTIDATFEGGEKIPKHGFIQVVD